MLNGHERAMPVGPGAPTDRTDPLLALGRNDRRRRWRTARQARNEAQQPFRLSHRDDGRIPFRLSMLRAMPR